MDIGLLHADVTQKMCHSWQSSIIHTICERAGMSNANSINRKAFCLLAGLPDIWLRTQTTRATVILVNINTRYCQSTVDNGTFLANEQRMRVEGPQLYFTLKEERVIFLH